MTTRLDLALSAAREGAPTWDADRASRVFSGAVRKKETRVLRHRAVRRVLVVASGATFLVLALLRTAGGARPESNNAPSFDPAPTSEAIAAHALDDGGYVRD